jgi:hypothetical protein
MLGRFPVYRTRNIPPGAAVLELQSTKPQDIKLPIGGAEAGAHAAGWELIFGNGTTPPCGTPFTY